MDRALAEGASNVSSAGLFGKVPAQGDFVRLNASTPAALAFDTFLQESLDGLRRTGGDLVPEPVRFAFFDAASGSGLCGVFAPSRDSVGRSYPLSVFVPIASPRYVSSLPIVTRDFVDAGGELLAMAEVLSGPDLTARAKELPSVSDGPAGAEALRSLLHSTGALWLWQTMFPEEPLQSAFYAVNTARLACDSASARASAGTGVVLDCPAPNEPAAFFWLAVVEARLASGPSAATVAPSFFWSASHGGRMLIALGRPPSALLTFLARPDSTSNRLWPLSTSVATARDAAARDIPPAWKQTMESPESSLLDVVEAVGRLS